MAENESIGGISVSIVGDYSKLQSDIQAAAQIAAQGGEEIASALTSSASHADRLSGAIADAATGIANFEARIQELVDTGSTLAEALAAVQGGVEGVTDGVGAAGGAASAAAQQMGLFDDAINIPYADAAGQLNLFADELEPIPGAAQSAAQAMEDLKNKVEDAAPAEEAAAGATKSLVEQLVAVGAALKFTEKLVDLGSDALHAADAVDDATRALGLLGGSAEEAQKTVAKLRDLGMDAALSMPELLTAASRMTAFLGSSKDVPGILTSVSNSAAVMGVSLEAAAGAFERIIASGDLSQRSLMRLGLTLEDVAKAMGTTAGKAADAFKQLDQSEKIGVLERALGKFNGAAKEMADDSLGALVRVGNQWDQTLEAIGKALDPVIKGMADFVSSDILPAVKGLAEAFGALPDPVKDSVIGIAAVSAAIVPLTGLLGAGKIALDTLLPAMKGVAGGFASLGQGMVGTSGSYGAMVAAGVLRVAVWTALAIAIMEAASAYVKMKEAEEGAAAAKKQDDDALAKLEISLRRQGIAIDDLQKKYQQGEISQTDYVRGLRDLVLEHNKANPVIQQYADATGKTATASDGAKIKMQSLKETVEETYLAYAVAKSKFDEHKASAADVTKAYDAWQSATGALKTEQDKLLPVVTSMHRVTRDWVDTTGREYPSAVTAAANSQQALNVKVEAETQALMDAQRWLDIVLQKKRDGLATDADVAKALDVVESTQAKLNKTIGEAPSAPFKEWAAHLNAAALEAGKLLPPLQSAPPYVRTVTDALNDLGIKTDKAGQIVRDKLLPAYRELLSQPHTVEQEAEAWLKVSGAVSRLALTDLPAALAAYDAHYQQRVRAGAKEAELLNLEASRYKLEIASAEQSGRAATSQIIALENVRLKQEVLYNQTHAWGDAYIGAIRAIEKGYDSIAGAVSDAIVDGKNFGDSMLKIGKDIERMIIDTLIGAALKQLKGTLLDIGGSVLGLGKSILGLGTTAAGPITDAAKTAASITTTAAQTAATTATTAANTAASATSTAAKTASTAFSSVFSMATGAISAVTGVIGVFQSMGMNKSLDVLVNHTLRIFNEVEQGRKDAWDQFNGMYGRIGEIWNDMRGGFDRLSQGQGSGIYDRLGEIWRDMNAGFESVVSTLKAGVAVGAVAATLAAAPPEPAAPVQPIPPAGPSEATETAHARFEATGRGLPSSGPAPTPAAAPAPAVTAPASVAPAPAAGASAPPPVDTEAARMAQVAEQQKAQAATALKIAIDASEAAAKAAADATDAAAQAVDTEGANAALHIADTAVAVAKQAAAKVSAAIDAAAQAGSEELMAAAQAASERAQQAQLAATQAFVAASKAAEAAKQAAEVAAPPEEPEAPTFEQSGFEVASESSTPGQVPAAGTAVLVSVVQESRANFDKMYARVTQIQADLRHGFNGTVDAINSISHKVLPPKTASAAAVPHPPEEAAAGLARKLPTVPQANPVGGPAADTYRQAPAVNTTTVGEVNITVHEAANPRETARQIVQTMKLISPRFASFAH